jgi:hypothetical protein
MTPFKMTPILHLYGSGVFYECLQWRCKNTGLVPPIISAIAPFNHGLGSRGRGSLSATSYSLFQLRDEPEESEGQAKWGRSFRVLNLSQISSRSRGGGNVGTRLL